MREPGSTLAAFPYTSMPTSKIESGQLISHQAFTTFNIQESRGAEEPRDFAQSYEIKREKTALFQACFTVAHALTSTDKGHRWPTRGKKQRLGPTPRLNTFWAPPAPHPPACCGISLTPTYGRGWAIHDCPWRLRSRLGIVCSLSQGWGIHRYC